MKTIHTLAEYVDIVSAITQLGINDLMSKPELLFRGLSSKNYSLVPGIGRTPKGPWQNTLQSVEKDLVESACKKFPQFFDYKYPALLLAKLQHYGIPTRMMDFSSNALVALYFACNISRDEEKKEDDGIVYVFVGRVCSLFNPLVNAVADTYRLTRNAYIDVNNYFYKVKLQDYFKPALYDVQDKSLELKWFIDSIRKPIFVDAGDFCDRQKNQQGKFLIFPNRIWDDEGNDDLAYEKTKNIVKTMPTMCDDLVDIEDEMIVEKITIPHENKSEIMEQLKRFGVSKEYLFADSIDEVCREIRNEVEDRFKE